MGSMDRAMFTKMAEQMHTEAEANMQRDGHLRQMVLLFDRNGQMTPCAVLGGMDDHVFDQLRKTVRAISAVAAIRIAEARALPLPPGADQLPYEDLPLPSESPSAQRQIFSEARWPWAGIHQVRITDVAEQDGMLTLQRRPADPDQTVTRNDVLAQLFPPVRTTT